MVLLVLAGGFARRLEPRTLKFPKQLLPVGKKTFLDLFFESLGGIKNRLDKVVLATNQKYYPFFADWSKNSSWPVKVVTNGVQTKEKKLGAIGDFLYALEKEKITDDVFVCASDYILPELDFNKYLDFFADRDASVTIARVEFDKELLKAGSCLEFEPGGRVIRFKEKPAVPFSIYYGIPYYIVKKDDIPFVRQTPMHLRDNIGQLVSQLVALSRVFAMEYTGKIIHVTTEEDYQKLLRNPPKF